MIKILLLVVQVLTQATKLKVLLKKNFLTVGTMFNVMLLW